MAEHPHVELVRRALRAMSEGDGAALVENVTADFVLNIPGDHLLSGEHKGRDADRQIFEQVRQETDNTYRPEPQRLFIDGRGHLICEWRTVADRRGRHLDALSAALFTIVGGRIASVGQRLLHFYERSAIRQGLDGDHFLPGKLRMVAGNS